MNRDRARIAHLLDCGRCRVTHPKLTRQMMGCGYEPELAPLDIERLRMRPQVWMHDAFTPDVDARGEPVYPKTCPGYACNLPEVLEVAEARVHWRVGELQSLVRKPRPDLLRAIRILDGEYQRVENWLMTPKNKGGGGA